MSQKEEEDTEMIMPSTAVILMGVFIFTVLLAIDWFVGAIPYSMRASRLPPEKSTNGDSAKTEEAA